ncbi:MAG: helix-turn-helix domain-containing protein, partial [Candidatus Izimaplasma sp.]|nr:helix-turn-helix domain-containing protein [Candidatus Izimaplasma bacterium]
MKYLSTKEIAEKWGINDRRVRVLCEEGRVKEAMKVGRNWMIAEDATKPYDARRKSLKQYFGLEYNFSMIDQMKKDIDTHRPLSNRLANSLHDKLIIEWT